MIKYLSGYDFTKKVKCEVCHKEIMQGKCIVGYSYPICRECAEKRGKRYGNNERL